MICRLPIHQVWPRHVLKSLLIERSINTLRGTTVAPLLNMHLRNTFRNVSYPPHVSLGIAVRTLDTGIGSWIGNQICHPGWQQPSGSSSRFHNLFFDNKAFMSTIQPLQLLHSDGKPWISVIFGLTPKNKKISISP